MAPMQSACLADSQPRIDEWPQAFALPPSSSSCSFFRSAQLVRRQPVLPAAPRWTDQPACSARPPYLTPPAADALLALASSANVGDAISLEQLRDLRADAFDDDQIVGTL